jgi:peptidoglycan/xylan/chitin deacetylase (PgdA/CDA1 family)
MALDPSHLQYPRRRHGMDHDRYAWSMLEQRSPVAWPQSRPLALWINVSCEHFPLDARGVGVKAHGSMTMPYPDLRHYTLRDYGNRVGVFRVIDALGAASLPASFAINGELARRYPVLLRRLAGVASEFVAHGWNMDCVHHGGMDAERERAWIADTLAALSPHAPAPIRGWLSPARSQSAATPDLLRAAGINWCADWVNDELPYCFETTAGALATLPLSIEIEDRFVIGENLHAESEWADQCIDSFDFLLEESSRLGQGRLFALNLHPWVIGQPHRVRHLERVLAHLARHRDALWSPAPSDIVDHVAVTD